MTRLLGKQPQYVGWLDMGTGGYGFVFRRQEKDVLVAWAPAGKPHPAAFASAVQVTTLAGLESSLPARATLSLAGTPIFVSQVPADLAIQAMPIVPGRFPGAETTPGPGSSPALSASPTPTMD